MSSIPAFDEYFPFDEGHGKPATTERWRKMARLFMADGMVRAGPEHLTDFQVNLTGGQFTVNPGAIVIHGYYAELINPVTIPVGTSGMVVGQVDMVKQVVSLEWLSGVTDYSGLTQSASIWQIPFWLINGSNYSWIGNTINPGRALSTGVGNFGRWYPLSPQTTTVINAGKARFTHPCLGFFHVFGQFEVTDARYAQNAVWALDLNYNLPGEILTSGMEPFFWPGGGGINGPPWPFHLQASFSWVVWVTPGLYTLGARITVGTGASAVKVANLGVNLIQTGSISNQ